MQANYVYLKSLLPQPTVPTPRSLAVESTVVNAHGVIDAIGAGKTSTPHHKTPWNPSEFELWVEHGVVWDLKEKMIMGFIDYKSIAPYFKPTPFRANHSMFNGSPFSLNDFPVYGYMGPPYMAWIFSALHMLSYLPAAWYLFRGQGLTNGKYAPPAGAGPVASAKDMGYFLAGSPSGTRTFSAKYVGYMWQLKPTSEPFWPPS